MSQYTHSSQTTSESIQFDIFPLPPPIDGVDYFMIDSAVRVRRYLPTKRTHTPYRPARIIRPILGEIKGLGVQRSYLVVLTDENYPGKGEEKIYVPVLGEMLANFVVRSDEKTRAAQATQKKLQDYIAMQEEKDTQRVMNRLGKEESKKEEMVFAYIQVLGTTRYAPPRMIWLPAILLTHPLLRPARVSVPSQNHRVYDNIALLMPFTDESIKICKARGQFIEY